jgi:hypothetical protein
VSKRLGDPILAVGAESDAGTWALLARESCSTMRQNDGVDPIRIASIALQKNLNPL